MWLGQKTIVHWEGNRSPKMSSTAMEIGDDDARMEMGDNDAGMEIGYGDGDGVCAGMEIGMTMWFG